MSARPTNSILSRGDVFAIPCGPGTAAIGQAIAQWRTDLYVAIFEDLVPEGCRGVDGPVAEAMRSAISITAATTDGEVYRGNWTVLGSAEVRKDVPFPVYKVLESTPMGGPRWCLVNVFGRSIRTATPAEVAAFDLQSYPTPTLVAGAVRAAHGLEPWLDAFDEYRPPSPSFDDVLREFAALRAQGPRV